MSGLEFNSELVEVGDHHAWLDRAEREGWTDGLPVVPPTGERVERFVEVLGADPEISIGEIPPANSTATIEKVAIACVMAGCKPEFAPVVVAAVKGMLTPAFNLSGIQNTTNPCAPLVIVNGPQVERLNFNARHGALGGGSRANATVGRAVRLLLWNLGGARPGISDMSPLGQPGKYSYCLAENEVESPWEPLHVEHGYEAERNVVSVFACDGPRAIVTPGDAARIGKILALSLPDVGMNAFHVAGQLLLVVNPQVADVLAEDGWSKHDLRMFLYENARWPLGDLQRYGILNPGEHTMTYWGGVDVRWRLLWRSEQMLPMVESPDHINIVVAGGRGQPFNALCPGWGNYGGWLTTQPVQEM